MDNLYGMFNLAYCLLNGDGCEKNSKNTKKGLEYLKKAALKGLDIAQLLYANRLHQQLTGDDPQRSIKDSVYWYTKAAFQGNFVSMNNLGHLNNQLAFQLFSIAASKGNEKAQINLALCYLWGKGIRRNEDQAVTCYKNAAEKGNAEAQMKLAKFLIGQYKQRQDPEIINEALRMLEMASKQGNAQAMFNYGLCFYKGIGVPRNELKAFDLFKASAFKKDPDALYVLGQIYFDGKSVVEDKTLALDYMQQAAVLNNTQAMYHIGISMDYFNQASDRGFVVATLKIAQLLLHGYEKIPMDKDKAIDLYKDLANKGNAKAQFSLGECYLKGDGVERDIERATYWFQTSSANNYTPASQQLLLLNYEIY
ncbi:tetratricopeptide repeat protein [Entamoeba marina]